MQIKDIMVTEVVTVGPKATITEIEQTLSKKHFHALPVVDDTRSLLGIITQYDLFMENNGETEYLPVYIQKLKPVADQEDTPKSVKENIQKIVNLTAEDIMTRSCLSLTPESLVKEAVLIFQKTDFGSIPV